MMYYLALLPLVAFLGGIRKSIYNEVWFDYQSASIFLVGFLFLLLLIWGLSHIIGNIK